VASHELEEAGKKASESRVRMRWASVVSFALFHTPPDTSNRPGYTRRILLFPFGNSNAPPNDTVSVYLDYADPKRAPEGWHACAQFALVISNPHDPTIYTVSRESS
jgi:hypothetical protein